MEPGLDEDMVRHLLEVGTWQELLESLRSMLRDWRPEATPWRFELALRIVPNWSIDGRFATLLVEGTLDRE